MLPWVKLTDAAAAHIQSMVQKSPNGIGFRLSIKKTGCSGYAYQPEIVEQAPMGDLSFTAQGGLSVYMAPACEVFLKGLLIDYVDDPSGGLKQKRLVFINPNEKNRCGCGESFTVD
jgi:iron-sulfur cluster assembly protein